MMIIAFVFCWKQKKKKFCNVIADNYGNFFYKLGKILVWMNLFVDFVKLDWETGWWAASYKGGWWRFGDNKSEVASSC
jgi:hypothetical protein